jgi:predicted phage terminase large subunit-like protein
MKVADLMSWFTEHRTQDSNYQHNNLSDDEYLSAAVKSWDRMTEERQTRILNAVNRFAPGLTVQKVQLYRFMAQTNLFALTRLLEKYPDMSRQEYVWTDGQVHNTHEEIANGFFVQKNPTFKTFKEFASKDNYVDSKERLLLVPRGGFKSSLNMCDCVQWIITFPEITILVLTGVLPLANDFVGEIKGHFTLEEGGECPGVFYSKKTLQPRETTNGTRSMFQVLFPEHCIPADDGKSAEYQTPAVSMTEKETTVFAASIEQNLAGWHVCIMKLDDVVTEENSGTVDRMVAVNKKVSIDKAMLHPFGFFDKIGTWYDGEDTYGKDIQNRDKAIAAGDEFRMKIYIRAAWWATEEAKKLGKIEDEMLETDYGYWFNVPGNEHSLTYKFLRYTRKTDPWFAIKYLNDPTQMHAIKFPRELLVRRTVPVQQLPDGGMRVMCVDTAYSTKSWADYTVIITALIVGGRFYILDMKRGKYNEYELPAMIATAAHQWNPKTICIEESVGVKWMGREAYREMAKLGIKVPIRFVTLGQGNKSKSKSEKAGPVLRYLGDNRMVFLYSMPGKEELYDELSKFGTAASTHDDIVDALAILVNQFAAYADNSAHIDSLGPMDLMNTGERAMHDRIFGGTPYQMEELKQEHANALKGEYPDPQDGEPTIGAGLGTWSDPFEDAGLYQ